MKLPLKAWALCVGGCAVWAVGSAHADSYSLDLGNSALSGINGPYGSVDVLLSDSKHAVITFTAGVVDGNQFLFGGADFNVNATSFSAISAGFSQLVGFSAPSISDKGSGNISSFGQFNQTFDITGGFTHTTTTLSFAVTDNSGTWPSAADVLTSNASGSSVAAHIFVTSFPGNPTNTVIVTGFAADGSPTVPDGGTTAAMLGAALSVFGLIRRKLN
jgi:hypothetical protein